MKKIINYIAGGQGLGIKFIALLALLLSIVFGATVKVMGSDAVPYAQQIADQMLPIKVVNGQIVEPADTYKVVHLRFNEDSDPYPIPLVLDTTSDVLDINMLDPGIMLPAAIFILPKNMKSVPTNWQTIILNCRGAIIPDFSGAF